MTGRLWLAAVVLAVLAAGVAGCRPEAEPAPEKGNGGFAATLRGIGGAPASLAVSEPMRPFFAAGLGFIVLGGVLVCCGGRGVGFILLGLGVATTATGVLFVQYPWSVLILTLAAGVVAALTAFDRLRARRALAETERELGRNREALEATAEVIQNIPEGRAVKAALTGLGTDAEETVRRVITPIKDKLRREGKIAG